MSSEITIPADVLCDIFHLLCDAPIALHDLKNESHFHEFPWAVGQVCRHWRGAFMSHTHLWTSFALQRGRGTFSGAYFAEMNRRATIYLERSGQQPLTIVVSMAHWGTAKFPKTVWRMLLSYLKRWKRANLVLGNEAVIHELLRCRGYMSSLESLRMSIPDSLAQKYCDAFQVAPHLTELDLVHHGCVATWQFPWAQLTKLKLEASWEEFNKDRKNLWGVLSRLENIEELHIIATVNFYLNPPPELPIIRLPGLRLLEISLAFSVMLSWFTVPLLEHLHIHGCNDRYSYNLLSYDRMSLIQRSSRHIRRLALENCTVQEMRMTMKILVSVEELSINYPSSFAIIYDLELDGCIYLPKLQVLQVKSIYYGDLERRTVTIFSRLLEARGNGSSHASHDIMPLKNFVLRLTMHGGKCLDKALEVMRGWPSFAQVYIDGSLLERLTPTPSL